MKIHNMDLGTWNPHEQKSPSTLFGAEGKLYFSVQNNVLAEIWGKEARELVPSKYGQ